MLTKLKTRSNKKLMTVGSLRFNLAYLKRSKPVQSGILCGILVGTLTSLSITNSASADEHQEADSVKFQLSGTVEAVKQHKVTADTKQFSSLKIKTVAECNSNHAAGQQQKAVDRKPAPRKGEQDRQKQHRRQAVLEAVQLQR